MKMKEFYQALQETGISYEQSIRIISEFAENASTIKDFGIGDNIFVDGDLGYSNQHGKTN